jgi:hypothetical protein
MNMVEDLELDNFFIDELEKEDAEYYDFYNEQVDNIKLYFIYIGKNNKIIFIKKDTKIIENNKLPRYELLLLIKSKLKYNNIKFLPLSILKYNVDIHASDIYDYIENDKKYNFLSNETNIKDINWNDTINLFKDINSLYILFYEEEKKVKKSDTKRIIFKKLKKKKTRKRKIK